MRYAVQKDQLSLTVRPEVVSGYLQVRYTDLFWDYILLFMQASDAKIAASLHLRMAMPRKHAARSKPSTVAANPGYAHI